MNRPLGVTIIAILALINGLLGLCLPGLVIIGGGISALFSGGLGLIVVCGGLLLAAGPLLWLIVSYGAWNLRPWAWWLGMIATGVTVVGVVVNIINGVGILQAVASAPLSIIIFIYLLLPDIRRAFGMGGAIS
jgi:uncharacterized membrane protein (DUF2068 family)